VGCRMWDQETLVECDDAPVNAGERRTCGRLPIDCRILLTPVDERTAILIDENVSTVGKDFSQTGARFTHNFPLTQQRFLLSFRAPELGEFVVEADVVWTRTTENGRLETGCRIIRKMIAPPLFA
jgi:hypothetical protein